MSDTRDKATDRSILPLPEPRYPAITEVDARKATPPPRFELKPPKGAGAPNVVFILMDNFGFGDPGCFGGPVNMPAFDRLATGGLRYTNMHTAPVCSPTGWRCSPAVTRTARTWAAWPRWARRFPA